MAEFNSGACRAELLANIKSNQYRIDKVEGKLSDMQEIVVCIREIAIEMKGMKEAQDEIKRNQERSEVEFKRSQERSQEEFKRNQELLAAQISAIERVPGKKAAAYIDKAINAALAAIVAFIMTRILSK